LRIIIIILLLLTSSFEIFSEEKDVNIYGTFPGYSFGFELDMEYCLLRSSLFGIESNTFIKYGASMFGFYDVLVAHSYPIIGFIQYFGDEKGIDIGANYFKSHNKNILDKSLPREQRIISTNDFEAVGFELGYRLYNDNVIYRFTYTPSYILTAEYKYGKQIIHLFGFSMGYSF